VTSTGEYGENATYAVYEAAFDADDFDNKAYADVTIKAYPRVGDADSTRTIGSLSDETLKHTRLYMNKDDDYDTKVAYLDTSATIAGSFISDTFTDGERI
jgi:hypothetical protein